MATYNENLEIIKQAARDFSKSTSKKIEVFQTEARMFCAASEGETITGSRVLVATYRKGFSVGS
jgi:hypothetical protein